MPGPMENAEEITQRRSAAVNTCFDACRDGNLDTVQRLLSDSRFRDAIISASTPNGATPFFIACEKVPAWCVRVWLCCVIVGVLSRHVRDPPSVMPLSCLYPHLHVVLQGHADIVKYLAETTDMDCLAPLLIGATPFYVACQNGHIDVVRYLAHELHVDVHADIRSGATPLYIACQNGHLDVCKLICGLRSPSTSSRAPGSGGRLLGGSPFFIACEKGHYEVR